MADLVSSIRVFADELLRGGQEKSWEQDQGEFIKPSEIQALAKIETDQQEAKEDIDASDKCWSSRQLLQFGPRILGGSKPP